jgi:two-component system cell cycle sensor histidine kinase/response regulator CckA
MALVQDVAQPDERLAWLFEAVPDAIVLVNHAGTVVCANLLAEELFGYAHGELAGLAIEALVPQRLRETHAAERSAYGDAPRARPMSMGRDLLALRRDGREVSVEISLNPLEVEGEQLVAAFVRDMTARRALEAERSELVRAQAIEQVVGSLEALVWESHDPQRTRIEHIGGSALLGYEPERWREDGFWQSILDPEDPLSGLAFAEGSQERDTFELEYGLTRADGGIASVRDRVTVIRSPDGSIERLRGVMVDVTERRQLEARFAQADKMEAVGQLAVGIAHEFNNLLTIVSGHAKRLVRQVEDASTRTPLDQIVTAADRAAELTKQLLAFSRRSDEKPEDVSLNDVVRGLVPMLHRLLGADITLKIDLTEGVPDVCGDRPQLEQIVMNLVLNARDAMPTGGSLSVGSQVVDLDAREALERGLPPGGYAVLFVTDTGLGMSVELQRRIFEPFFTSKPVGKGTGLGLSMVYATVLKAHGFVDVESSPGQGTTFRVGMPVAPSGTTAALVSAGPPLRTVLVVEDEPALRELAAAIFEETGYHVLQASDGQEAVRVAEAHPGRIDLLLTDVVMPLVSGPELARQLRHARPGTPVLYMSGYTDSRLVNRGLDSRSQIIHKPFDPDELSRRAAELIRASDGDGAGRGSLDLVADG